MDRSVSPEPPVDLFDHLPVLAVLATLDDRGIPVIEDCNDRFARRLGQSHADLVGEPLRSVYASDSGADGGFAPPLSETVSTADGGVDVEYSPLRRDRLSEFFEDRSAFESESRRRHSRAEDAVDDGAADPEAVECDLIRADGTVVHTIAESIARSGDDILLYFIDVTRHRRREMQAEVLNRLMRHNVRNDLNLLRGYARTLADHDDEAVADAAEVIDRIADRWLGLAGKIRQIERLFGADPDPVPIQDVVESARTSVEREWPNGRVHVDVEVDAERCVSESLHVALVELCENGIKHATDDESDAASDAAAGDDESADAGTDSPHVTVTVEDGAEPEWITVRVADEGSGIPPHELAALRAGAETPLQHGSGLGFWLARFVVQQLGGDVSARSNDDGSVVSLDVPLAEESTESTR
jgi:signal transduction histidine kinase